MKLIFNHSLLDDDEHEWIIKTCRKGWDENVDYKENYQVFSRCYNIQNMHIYDQ